MKKRELDPEVAKIDDFIEKWNTNSFINTDGSDSNSIPGMEEVSTSEDSSSYSSFDSDSDSDSDYDTTEEVEEESIRESSSSSESDSVPEVEEERTLTEEKKDVVTPHVGKDLSLESESESRVDTTSVTDTKKTDKDVSVTPKIESGLDEDDVDTGNPNEEANRDAERVPDHYSTMVEGVRRAPKKAVVKTSTISGSGMGLFLQEDVKQGEVVARYSGKLLTRNELLSSLWSGYVVKIKHNLYLDASGS